MTVPQKSVNKKPKKPYRITVCCQKGGVGKSTTTIILAYLLSEMGYKVLLVDLDQQGNATETYLQMPIREFRLKGYLGVYWALAYLCDPEYGKNEENHPKEYLWTDISPNLHIMPADERTGYFSNLLHKHNPPRVDHIVADMLDMIDEGYDYVIIDTAPSLSSMLTNALVASDGAIAVYQPEKYCYSAMFSLFETFEEIRKVNPKLTPLGILTTLSEVNRSDMKQFIQMMQENEVLGPYLFKTVIRRKASTGRLAYAGFFENPEVKDGVKQYVPFVKEVLKRGKKN